MALAVDIVHFADIVLADHIQTMVVVPTVPVNMTGFAVHIVGDGDGSEFGDGDGFGDGKQHRQKMGHLYRRLVPAPSLSDDRGHVMVLGA